MEYPQQDYLNFQRYGYPTNIITKPHNLYLQIAVQDGMIALLAFLAFYAMYFISSIRLYIKGRFHNFYEQMGVAIFVGTIGYMVTGLTNDSSITTAPIFWALMGIGISVNYRVKSLNTEEQKKS
jgi:O-antigen ligase